jgi:hypothetical protein
MGDSKNNLLDKSFEDLSESERKALVTPLIFYVKEGNITFISFGTPNA